MPHADVLAMTPETPAQAGPGAGGPLLSEGQYEFREDENVSIERAGTGSSIWAACAILGAVPLGVLASVQLYLDNSDRRSNARS